MAEISFYQLTNTPLEKALPLLMEKVLASGKRGLVLVKEEAKLKTLDNVLWTYSSPKFLPHGTEKDGQAEKQPIFLTQKEENPNKAEMLVLVDGQEPAFLPEFSRVLDVFDGRDETQLAAARARWAKYKHQGLKTKYFRQNEKGGWEEAA